MFTSDQLNQVSTLLNESQSILILFPAKATFDAQAAANGVAQSLQALGNKEVHILTPHLEEYDSSIFGSVPVRSELGNKTLQVSFPYSPTTVDKVSYNIDEANQRFYLTVQPQKGEKPLDYHDLEYAYVGADADLIILVGVTTLDSLEQLYFGYEEMFKDTTIITLNTYETTMGNVKLNSSGMTSLSEATTILARSLSLPLPAEAATQLLSGIEQVTRNFTSFAATADTFESVAYLMRQGARRIKRAGLTPALVAAPKPTSLKSQLKPQTDSKDESKKKSTKNKNGKTISLNQDKVKAVGGLKYQPSESSMGARG